MELNFSQCSFPVIRVPMFVLIDPCYFKRNALKNLYWPKWSKIFNKHLVNSVIQGADECQLPHISAKLEENVMAVSIMPAHKSE